MKLLCHVSEKKKINIVPAMFEKKKVGILYMTVLLTADTGRI